MQLAQEGNAEAGPLGPPESPMLLGRAIRLLADHGTAVDQLAGAARLPLEQVNNVVRAGSDTRPRLELPQA
jgi:hypothetical protein